MYILLKCVVVIGIVCVFVCGQNENNGYACGVAVGGQQQPHIPPSMWSTFYSGFLPNNEVTFQLLFVFLLYSF